MCARVFFRCLTHPTPPSLLRYAPLQLRQAVIKGCAWAWHIIIQAQQIRPTDCLILSPSPHPSHSPCPWAACARLLNENLSSRCCWHIYHFSTLVLPSSLLLLTLTRSCTAWVAQQPCALSLSLSFGIAIMAAENVLNACNLMEKSLAPAALLSLSLSLSLFCTACD